MAINSPNTFSFSSAFVRYGQSLDSISQEIRNNVISAILQARYSRDFSRAEGIGLEELENEANSAIQYSIWVGRIVESIQAYNATVPFDYQVAVTQDLVDIFVDTDEPSTLFIQVRYVEVRSINEASPRIEDVVLPVRS